MSMELFGIILTVLAAFAAPTDALGDRSADIIAARGNSVRSIGVTWGYGDRDELADADQIVASWEELLACLGRQPES